MRITPKECGKNVEQTPGLVELLETRSQRRCAFLEVGRALVAEARDRIDATVDVVDGAQVLDQPGAELDESVQVVDGFQPVGRIESRDLGAVEREGGRV